MAAPHAPIIVLRKSDDAVSAFFTTPEAVAHIQTHPNEALDALEFFDARGRRLSPIVGAHGLLEGLDVETDQDYGEHVRERVRRRSGVVRPMVERYQFARIDESPLTLADEDIIFEIFAWRLASVLRDDPTNPYDPVPQESGPRHVAGWWHNMFGH